MKQRIPTLSEFINEYSINEGSIKDKEYAPVAYKAKSFFIVRKSTERKGGLNMIFGQLSASDIKLFQNAPMTGSIDIFQFVSEDEMLKIASEWQDEYGANSVRDGRGETPIKSRRPDNGKEYYGFNSDFGQYHNG
jgi:hypothetical protein